MDRNDLHAMREEAELELGRIAYPSNFPPMPDVPSARYADPTFHELEMAHLWPKTWLHAGHVSELPEPGAYKLFEKLGLSIIVIRSLEGEIRAFHNVCRHRGSALLTEPKGRVRGFICPYHAWSYSLDGALKAVPEERNFACLDKTKRGLSAVRCESWNGFIFLNLDAGAAPLSEFLAPVTREVADFPIGDMMVKNSIVMELDCNWKAAYDNFLEPYHVAVVHSKSIAPYFDNKSFTTTLLKNGHCRATMRKAMGNTIFTDGIDIGEGFSDKFNEYTVSLPMFPNIFTALDPFGFPFQTFWPLGPSRCLMEVTWMGWKRSDEEDRKFWEKTVATNIAILNEDLFLFSGIQKSMESKNLPGVMLSFHERQIYWYQEEIDRVIGIDRVPEDLRIAQVLLPQTAC